jgi:hypothetical protein
MDLLDIEVAQLAYEDRLRNAEQRRRPLVLGYDVAGQAPIEGANGLWDVIRQWLRTRTQQRPVRDAHRPRAI